MNGLLYLPLVGQPVGQVADGNQWPIDQQLRDVALWIDVMSAAGAGQACKDGRRFFTTRIADERAVIAVEHDALHLPLANIAVDRHGAIRREDVQLAPLAQSTTDRFGHGMPWQ